MKRTARSIAAATCLSIGVLAHGVAAQPPAPSTPTAEHQRLGFFVGKWTIDGEMKSGPMGPGGKITSNDTCEWFEGRFVVVCRTDGTGPMGPSKGLGIMGYSADAKAYTYYGVDNSGMLMTTIPRGTVKGDTWTYTDESTMGGQNVKSRVTIKEVSPTAYTFLMEMQGPDGKWMPFIESKATKAK